MGFRDKPERPMTPAKACVRFKDSTGLDLEPLLRELRTPSSDAPLSCRVPNFRALAPRLRTACEILVEVSEEARRKREVKREGRPVTGDRKTGALRLLERLAGAFDQLMDGHGAADDLAREVVFGCGVADLLPGPGFVPARTKRAVERRCRWVADAVRRSVPAAKGMWLRRGQPRKVAQTSAFALLRSVQVKGRYLGPDRIAMIYMAADVKGMGAEGRYRAAKVADLVAHTHVPSEN